MRNIVDRSKLSTAMLALELAQKSRAQKAPAFVELLSRSSLAPQIAPELAALGACGTRYGARTAGRQIRMGRQRCKLTSCPRCAEKLGKKAKMRARALIAAATGGEPDPEHISLVTINWDDLGLEAFRGVLTRVFRKLAVKYVGRYSVSAVGKLHVHVVILHQQHSRKELKDQLKSEFNGQRQVHAVKIKQSEKLDGVERWVAYAHGTVKGRDLRRYPVLRHPDGLARYVMADSSVVGRRKCEGGFTLVEKAQAKLLMKSMDPVRVRAGRKLTSALLETIRQYKRDSSVRLTSTGLCKGDSSTRTQVDSISWNSQIGIHVSHDLDLDPDVRPTGRVDFMMMDSVKGSVLHRKECVERPNLLLHRKECVERPNLLLEAHHGPLGERP